MQLTELEKPTRYEVYLTFPQFQRLHAIDKEWIGSEHYMGLAYFWAYEYRYPMRETSAYDRVRVHRAFLEAGLEPSGESDEHQAIINRLIGDRYAYRML